ncbi:uncharacterized protein IUM83_03399 [Phytophthora cinnamomi]|uniref:uncharacterized protein n=1 Tax=Phytophthora cinnamomi TaxID=4785 RepID=UPI003559FA14|nr:hypothetical protein IUM83_03399 [Phytophthora cinnamomi]
MDDVPCLVLKILLHTEHLAESMRPSRRPLLDTGVKVSHTTLVSFFLRTVSSSNAAGMASARLAGSPPAPTPTASILPASAPRAGISALAQLCSSTVVQAPPSWPRCVAPLRVALRVFTK